MKLRMTNWTGLLMAMLGACVAWGHADDAVGQPLSAWTPGTLESIRFRRGAGIRRC